MIELSPGPSVPPEYLGVWQRILLRAPGIEDATTRVYWMQTASWHADIRVPASRPRRDGTQSLADLTRGELAGLAQQQGFCGTTLVEGDICRWLRREDFQPPSGRNDIGRMVFDGPDRVLEYGVEANYFEIWERLPDSTGAMFARGGNGEYALGIGEYRMRVVPRRFPLPAAENLGVLAAKASDEVLRGYVDFEISFGRRCDARGWRIELSTLPWREGEIVAEVT